MATVYLARDAKHDRNVAIKVLHLELAAILGADRFLQEIRVIAQLQHPHILGLIDSGLIEEQSGSGGRPYYVMPYIEGESLRQRLQKELQLPIADALRIATEVASALDYAHRHGVIHRDIKPENILLHDGSAIVADFGIALAVSEAGGARLTASGVSLGTPAYMSPEQAVGERVLTARTDIYALGVVTYEMLAGEPPFNGPTSQALFARMMTEEPRALTTVRRNVPQHVDLAVSTALERIPADRFGSAHEFADALNDVGAMPSSRVTKASQPGRRKWLQPALYGGAALVALLLITAIWGWIRPTPPKPVLRYALTFDSTEAITTGGSYATRIALSNDGSRLAYIGGSRAQLWVRSRSQLRANPIPSTEGTMSPFFSPDGQQVAVLNEGALRVIPLAGGEPFTITDSRMGVAGASWGPDNFIYIDGGGLMASLVRVEAKPGSTPVLFTAMDSASGEIDHTWPDVLPNGKGVLFTVTRAVKPASDIGRTYFIAVASVPSGKHRILLEDALYARYSPSGHVLYVTTDRRLMVVPFDQNSMKITGPPSLVVDGMRLGSYGSADLAVSRMGTLLYGIGGGPGKPELNWVTREGVAQSVDSTWVGFFWNPAISPDGSRLAVEVQSGTGSIWIKRTDHGPPVRLTFQGDNGMPTWTPDGRSVTFWSDVDGSPGLWTQKADGSARAVLQFRDKRGAIEPRWSPDGKWLVFATAHKAPGSGDIVGVRPGKDTVSVPLVATSFSENSPAISPDGRWLAYQSDESGREEIYVVPFPNTGAAKWLVSTRGGREPVWSHSGRELFYRDGDGSVVVVPVLNGPAFSMGAATILFPAASFRVVGVGAQYAVMPDDRRFLMIRRSSSSATERLIVVENWLEELKASSAK